METIKSSFSPGTLIKMILFILIMPFITLLISWKWDWWEAWVYGLISVLGFIISRKLAVQRNPDILEERASYGKQEDTQPWDKILSPLVALGGMFILIVAGLDMLFRWPPEFSLPVKLIALTAVVASYALGSYALIENRYFSGVVRLQTERGHKVVSGGPYRWMRHPGYAGTLLTYLATPFLLDSAWALIPAMILVILMVIRTRLEDRFLHQNLDGYADYAKRTRFRLIPGIW
ncbi:MAG: isoprenylcysteine carboxylmethyltransferase family protein [Leptolinea sp.]|jgi:protein-S-isoprenylcysteine O-methyltransferase Ste14|nr:isoprenylcysteine carboxylmethyltransferase family protein [Leptolinea sp.]